MSFRSGHGSAGTWGAAVARALAQVGRAPFPRGPGFLYLTQPFARDAGAIVTALREATSVHDWLGSTGAGILASGVEGGIEYRDEPALALLLADWSADDYRLFSGRARPPTLTERTPGGAVAAQFAVVHADPDTPEISELVEDMAAKVASGFIVGGISGAADDAKPIQIANEVLQGGLSGVVLSSAIGVATRHTQGCEPIGARRVVTQGERNVIATIDGRPALDVFLEIVGPSLADDPRRAALATLVGLPVAGSDTGDYLVRNIVGIDPRNKLIAIGAPVATGMPILFCRRDRTAATADLERMLDRLMADLDADGGGPPRGALYFSCLGRGEHMFGSRSAELAIVRERLGPVPLAGFFANGEILHDRLYGYTGVLTVFR